MSYAETPDIVTDAVVNLLNNIQEWTQTYGVEMCVHQMIAEAILRGLLIARANPGFAETLSVRHAQNSGCSIKDQQEQLLAPLLEWSEQFMLEPLPGPEPVKVVRRGRRCQLSPRILS